MAYLQGSLVSFSRMRRSVHIAIALLAILTLIRPFDCFAGTFTRKAMACCSKGKCLPSSNADDCCKGTVPAGSHLSAPKVPDHLTSPQDLAPAAVLVVMPAPAIGDFCFEDASALTPSPPYSRLNLPLLI